MITLESQLKKIKQKKIGIMTHVVVGYPSLLKTAQLVKQMAVYADFIELQIPFSDPLADGPTIMRACEDALTKGTKVIDALTLMKQLAPEVNIPLLFMAYYNTVFRYGTEKFIKDAKAAGCAGLIVPDMPIDEEPQEHFYFFCKKHNLSVIHVVSPASTDDRLQKNARLAEGFVYATARQGITGAKKTLDSQTLQFLQRVRKYFQIPIAVGFGIADKSQIETLKQHAEIAVIGSIIIEKMHAKENITDFLKDISMLE